MKPEAPATRRVAVYALTRRGAALAARLREGLAYVSDEAVLFLPRRLSDDFAPAQPVFFDALKDVLVSDFHRFQGHVVVGAAGLVVRLIAPVLTTKKEDPAVVVLPQDGRFAVSLLSGHLGGGNQLAWETARISGGQAVVSTATDVEGLPAMEMLARDHDLVIENFAALPVISRMLVEGEKLPVFDPGDFLWPHLEPWPESFVKTESRPEASIPHIRVDWRQHPDYGNFLTLRPKVVALGLGCHRGIDLAEMFDFVLGCLRQSEISPLSVALLASVETRREEPALLALSREMARPLMIFTKEELGRITTPNPSAKVEERIGVPSVCEAAAMLAARTERLIISKKKSAKATLAAALCGWK